MDIREVKAGDVLVLAPDGSVAGSEETSAIATKLAAALKAGSRFVVLDCAAVGQLDSAAIRVLLMTSRKLERIDGRLVLCGMNARLVRAFSISGFNNDFVVVPTRDEAVQRVVEPALPRAAKVKKAAAPAEPAVVPAPPPPPVKVEPAARTAAPTPAPAAPQAPVKPPPVSGGPPPVVPDVREAQATALLDALGARVARPDAGRSGHTPPAALEAFADAIQAALAGSAS